MIEAEKDAHLIAANRRHTAVYLFAGASNERVLGSVKIVRMVNPSILRS